MSRSLEFYLDLGCEVRAAADGWVLLCAGPTSLVLQVTAPDQALSAVQPRAAAWPLVALMTPHARALRWRLRAAGVPVGRLIRTPQAPGGEFELLDPDSHRITIRQSADAGREPRAATPRAGSMQRTAPSNVIDTAPSAWRPDAPTVTHTGHRRSLGVCTDG